MADLDKVDRNLQRLIAQNASDEDLAGYLAHEGVTEDQIIEHKSQNKGFASAAASWVGDTYNSAASAVKGKQDPAFADVGTVFDQFPGELQNPTANAATFGADDAAMGDIVARTLGDKVVRREKDANGYEIFVTRGLDGKEQLGYLNKSGLDSQDVARGIRGALPYAAIGGPIGMATRGLGGWGGMVVRAGSQGAGAGATSLAGDAATILQGSEQGVDFGKAGTAAVLASGAEVALPVAGAAYRYFKGPRPHVNAAGALTDNAKAVSKSVGLNPDDLSAAEMQMFATGLNKGSDPREIASLIQTNRFGIETTKATRTGDFELSLLEKDIRYGTMGQDAKQHLDKFYGNQRRQIEESALSKPIDDQAVLMARVKGEKGDPYTEGMGSLIAPTRTATSPQDISPNVLGTSIQGNLKAVKDSGDDAIRQAYEPMSDTTPKPSAFDLLPDRINRELGEFRVNDGTPTAVRMVENLADYRDNKALVQSKAGDFLKQAPVRTLLEKQKQLYAMSQSAGTAEDRTAASAIYRGFTNWIDDIADQGLVNGDAAAAAGIRTARSVAREVKDVFNPRGKAVNPAAAKILSEIVERDNNADSIVAALFGTNLAQPKPGSIDALKRIKRGLFEKVGGKRLADPLMAERTWSDIRMAYWGKLILDSSGKMHTPAAMVRNIETAIHKQYGVMRTLFEEKELLFIRQYRDALRSAIFRDPNASGTSTALRSLSKNDGSWMKDLLMAQSNRELFSKHNVFMSRFYRVLAKKLPVDVFGLKAFSGASAARKATSQEFSRKPYQSYGPVGSVNTPWMSNEQE